MSFSSIRAPLDTRVLLTWSLVGSSLVAAAFALRYLVFGADAVWMLRAFDGLFERMTQRDVRFFAGFTSRQAPRYHAAFVPLIVHIVGTSIALGSGAFQLLGSVRRRAPKVHRWLGWIYALSAFCGGLAGAYLAVALPMVGSRFAVVSNVTAGLAAAGLVAWGVKSHLAGNAAAHGRFMLRSYAVLTTLQMLYLLILGLSCLGVPLATAYEAAHDLCLPLNLLVVEVGLRSRRLPGKASVVSAAGVA